MNQVKKIVKPPSLITSLAILDDCGRLADGSCKLKSGTNIFSCEATYIDGSTDKFAAYWTCPIVLNGGGVDFYGVLGSERRQEVVINASPNHERYTSITCWVKFPDGPNTDAGMYPHASIGFDYSEINHVE